MQAAPERREVVDFKFSRLCSLRLFPSSSKLDRKYPLNIVATSNKFGLIFAPTPSGVQCIPLSHVVEIREKLANNRVVVENYSRRELNLGCTPSNIAVNSSGDLLAIVFIHQECPVLQIYVVESFANQEIAKLSEVRLSGSPGSRVLDLQWNPAIANTIGAVISDGSALVVEISLFGGAPTISSAPTTANAMCLCWSPKGKQVVLGSSDGKLTQYKPDLKCVKTYPPPQVNNCQFAIISIHWISSFQFIAVYKDKVDPQARSVVMVVNVPKNAPQTFVNFDEVCLGSDSTRHEHYFIHIAAWNVVVVSVGNGMEASVLGLEGDSWVQWDQDEGGRAELPQPENHDDVFTVGMALNTNGASPPSIGDTASSSPTPLLLMMSEEGVLSIFHILYQLPNVASLCHPSEPLSRHFFTIPAAGEPATPSTTSTNVSQPPRSAPSSVDSGEAPVARSPFQPAQTVQPPTQSPFTLPSAGLQMPAFPMSPSPLAQTKPAPPQTQQNIPKPQYSFDFGAVNTSQNSTAPLQTLSPATSVGYAFSAVTSTIAQSIPQIPPTSSVVTVVSSPHPTATSMTMTPVSNAASLPPVIQKVPSPGPPPVDEAMLKNEIKKEVESIETLLGSFTVDTTAVNKLIKDTKSLPWILSELDDLETFEKELKETTIFQLNEMNSTKVNLIEKWGDLENVKAKQRQSTSQRYIEAVEYQELDPALKKLLSSIARNSSYVETKITETTEHLNSLWEEQKRPGSLKNFDIPSLEALYQILSTNLKNLSLQKERVKKIENKLETTLNLSKKKIPRVLNVTNSQWSGSKTSFKSDTQLEQLADKLLQTRLDSSEQNSNSFKETSSRYIALASFRRPPDSEKEISVWKMLKSHKVIRTKAARPAMPENEVLNRSFVPSTPPKTSDILETPAPSTFMPPGAKNLGSAPFMVTSTPIVGTAKSGGVKPVKGLFTSGAAEQENKPRGARDVSSTMKSPGLEAKTQTSVAKSIFGFSTPSVTTASNFPFSQTKQPDYPKTELSPVSPFQLTKESAKSVVSKPTLDENVADKEKRSQAGAASSTLFGTSPTVHQTPAGSPFAFNKPPIGSIFPLSASLGSSGLFPTSAKAGDSSSSAGGVTTPPQVKATPVGHAPVSTPAFLVSTKFESPAAATVASNVQGSDVSPSVTLSVPSTKAATVPSFPSFLSESITSVSPSAAPSDPAQTSISTTPVISTVSSLFPPDSAVTITPVPQKPANEKSSPATSLPPFGAVTRTATTSPPSFPFLNPQSTTTTALGTQSSNLFQTTPSGTTSSQTSPAFALGTTSATIFGGTATTTNIFGGVPKIPTSSIFGGAATTTTSNIFGGATTSTSTVLVGASTTTTSTPFGGTISKTIASSNVFGGVTTTATSGSVEGITKTTPTATVFGGTTPAVTEESTGTVVTSSVFGAKTATTTSSIFGGTTPAAVEGSTVTVATSTIFGASSAPPTSTIFGGSTTTSAPTVFGGTLPTSSANLFGGVPATTTTNLFGGTTTTNTQPGFVGTASTTSISIFGGMAPTTAATSFSGTTAASPPNLYQTPQKTTSLFSGTPSFGTPTGVTPLTIPQPAFGTPTTPQSVFGSQTTSAQSPFGSQPSSTAFTATTASSVFGTPTQTTSNVFGAANALSNTSFFGSPATTSSTFGGATPAANIFGGSSSFSTPSTATSSIFGAAICSPSSTQPSGTSNVFGAPFGAKPASPSTPFGGSPSFASSFRPTTPGGFGSSGGSMFGGGSTFSQPAQQGGLFQSGNSSPGLFGSPTQGTGAFSGSGQTVQQTGFGSFGRGQPQQPRPFGASGAPVFGGQANFGAPPAFGGAATFGAASTGKAFGTTTPAAAPAFGSPTQQNATFENLAGQNTVSFGNLAQSQPAFGSNNAFGQPQQQQQPQQPQQQQTSAFSMSGSSFSSWR